MDDILKRYIDRVLQIQATRPSLSDQDLREIAREIGLSEHDLQQIDKQVNDGVIRAKGFMKHGIWSKAIAEWEQVLTLSPTRKNARSSLAFCYLHENNYAAARSHAEDALRSDPTNTRAFEVLKSLEQTGSSKSNFNIAYIAVLAFFAFAIVFGFGYAIYSYLTYEDQQDIVLDRIEKMNKFQTDALLDRTPSPPKPTRKKPSRIETLPATGSAVLPIEVDLPKGLEIKTHSSEYKTYKEKSYYTLVSKVQNNTDLEISEMKGTFTYLLEDGNKIRDVKHIQRKHAPVSRPGDFSHFYEIRKISLTTLKSVSLKIEIVASSPALETYPASKPIALKRGKDVSSQQKLKIFERSQSLGRPNSFGQYHKASWEIKNLGATIRKLRLNVHYLSEDNEILAEHSSLVTYSSRSPIEPNEVRLFNTIQKLPSKRFHRYELIVAEIE